jgi:hypothetical protein
MDRAKYHASVGNDVRAVRHARRGFEFGSTTNETEQDTAQRTRVHKKEVSDLKDTVKKQREEAQSNARAHEETVSDLTKTVNKQSEDILSLNATIRSLKKKNETQVSLNATLTEHGAPENKTRNNETYSERYTKEDIERCKDAKEKVSKALDHKSAEYTSLKTTCDREKTKCDQERRAMPCEPVPSNTSACTIV